MDPRDQSERPSIPRPEETFAATGSLNPGLPRWSAAPAAVKYAWFVNLLGLLVCVSGFVNGLRIMREPAGMVAGVLIAAICGVLILIEFWMLQALRQAEPTAHGTQKFLAILGLVPITFWGIPIPFGTILNAILLAMWGKPEVKAWFNRP